MDMNFNDLKDINKIKGLALDIAKDFNKEIDKIKDVNKERFIEGFNKCFVEWLMNEYFEFKGRVSRCRFWIIVLYSILVSMGLGLISAIFPFLGYIVYIYSLAILIPSVCLIIRRLHDINFPAWWFLIALIPYLGAIALVFLLAIPGDNKSNNYGAKVK